MSKKELIRGEILSKTVNGNLSQKKASEELNVSLRHIKRLCKRMKEEGLSGLAHRNRGKRSRRKVNPNTRAKILGLIKSNYLDFGPQLIKEQLETRHQIPISREWIRGLMIQENLWEVKKRKTTRHYQRRNRRPREGELLQIDGSPEYWFEDRGPKCCLINMVDDATGKIMECRFVEEECLSGYFLCMANYLKRYGRPLSIYSDRHTIFKSPKEGGLNVTQFGRAMRELGIDLIYANSPQAKGRVERSHGVLQDRLIKMMRLEKISSIEEGNKYLEKFREEYNKRFGRAAQQKENAHRAIPPDMDLTKILCRKEERKVSKSLEIQYKNKTYQIIPQRNSRRLVGARVSIIELEKGVVIQFQEEELEYKVYGEMPYQNPVLDRKRIDAFLDRKKPQSVVEKHRKKITANF